MTTEPIRLLDGGLVDGETASPDMLELLGVLRASAPETATLAHLRTGAVTRGSWGRWLVPLAFALAAGVPWATASSAGPTIERAPEGPVVAALPETAPAALHEPENVTDAIAAVPSETPTPLAAAPDVTLAVPRTITPARRRVPHDAATPVEEHAVEPLDEGPVAPVASAGELLAMVPPEEDTAPSETYAAALSEYARGCCDCALGSLQRVIEGSTGDAPRAVRRAELLLGVCLRRTGWPQSALSVLDAIVESGPEHPYFSEALSELARLAPELPDPSVLVSTFRHDDEARLSLESDAAATDAAAYLQGRARYDDGDLETATRLLGRVSATSPFYRAARLYEGLAQVRLRHSGPAEAAFQAVVDASPEGDRFRDLATLSLARLYYSAAESRHAEGNDEREAELLAAALVAWRRVPISSEHFLDAFFEESWALYLAGDDERALGHVFGLLSPFFEDTEHPEAYVIRGTIHFEHCLYDEAEADVRDFHARYDEVLPALDDLASMDDAAAIALHEGGAMTLAGATRSMVAASILDRDALHRSEHVRAIEAELARVPDAAFGDGPLGSRLTSELTVGASFARARLADGVRQRIRDVRDALVLRMNEIDTIALETTTARRDVLTGAAVLSEESRREAEVIAAVGVEVWPFDGEYWEDEVPYYREVVRDRCGR